MAKADPIPPFPADLDRDAFGHWLSGFSDGEGSFQLRISSQHGRRIFSAAFLIKLRSDDLKVLDLIRSYLRCGRLSFSPYPGAEDKRFCTLCIGRTMDLSSVIVPHFDRYPLRAKKRGDFLIWKEGVSLLASIWHRPQKLRGPNGGTFPRWRPEESAAFDALFAALREQRTCRPA